MSFRSVAREPGPAPAGVRTAMQAPSYRILIAVVGGLHQGAAFVGNADQSVVVGSSPGCDLVLLDEGVDAQALCLFVREGALAAQILSGGVRRDGIVLERGLCTLDCAQAALQVGGAQLSVELLRRSQAATPSAGGSAAPSKAAAAGSAGSADPVAATHPSQAGPLGRRSLHWWGLGIALALTATGVAALVRSQGQPAASEPGMRSSRSLAHLVDTFNRRGAELEWSWGEGHQPLLRGYVHDGNMRWALEGSLGEAGIDARLELHDVQLMTDALERLARLAGHACRVGYEQRGRFACVLDTEVPGGQDALHALARDIAGVRSWRVQVSGSTPPSSPSPSPSPSPSSTPSMTSPAIVEAAAPASAPSPSPSTSPSAPARSGGSGTPGPSADSLVDSSPSSATRPGRRWPVVWHVAPSDGAWIAYDARGRRWRVGDTLDGARLVTIRPEGVVFLHEGKRIEVGIAGRSTPTAAPSQARAGGAAAP